MRAAGATEVKLEAREIGERAAVDIRERRGPGQLHVTATRNRGSDLDRETAERRCGYAVAHADSYIAIGPCSAGTRCPVKTPGRGVKAGPARTICNAESQ